LRDLHSIGVVHNDIKLDNLLIYNGSKTLADTLHLIDFGLSQLFEKNNSDGTKEHIKKENLNAFSGNFIFASINSYLGYTKSRKDDLESALYLIIFLFNKNYLPWLDICKN
jgi:serine/threonine protein kinase